MSPGSLVSLFKKGSAKGHMKIRLECQYHIKEDAKTNIGNDPGNPNPWSNKDFQPWLFGHDVFKEANEALDRMNEGLPS